MEMTKLATYEGAAIPGSEIQDAADDAITEILGDPASRAELRQYGLDEKALRGFKFTVEQEPGIVPGVILIAILYPGAGQLAADGVEALWKMTLRRIKKKKGGDALGEER